MLYKDRDDWEHRQTARGPPRRRPWRKPLPPWRTGRVGRELREHKAAIVPAVNCIISSEGYSTSRNRTLKEWGEQRQKHKKVRRPSQYSTAKRGAMSQRDTHTHTHKVVHRGRDNAQLRASRLRYFEVNSSSWFRMSEVPTCCTHHRRCKLGDGKAHD